MNQGLLLLNLGTPDNPSNAAVRRYLREFLSDSRVIDIPATLRYMLLYGAILPFRTRRSARAYKEIWTADGSPLLYHHLNLVKKLQDRLDGRCHVALGMRYGQPTIKNALTQLQHCESITVLPLYPQYSSAATGSSIERAMGLLTSQASIPALNVIRDFHSHPSYIDAQVEVIKPYIADHDYLLFSYHGVPERHLLKAGCIQICKTDCPSNNSICYRAQCLKTTALIAKGLELHDQQYGTSFQSRLGRTPWVKPYTDMILTDLIAQGIKRIAIVCPSFVADCLETLEEIGMRAKEKWIQLGGEQLTLVPCLNENETWISAIISIAGLDLQHT